MKSWVSQWCIMSLLMLTVLSHEGCEHDHEELLTVSERWSYGMLAGLALSLIGFFAAFALVLIGINIKS